MKNRVYILIFAILMLLGQSACKQKGPSHEKVGTFQNSLLLLKNELEYKKADLEALVLERGKRKEEVAVLKRFEDKLFALHISMDSIREMKEMLDTTGGNTFQFHFLTLTQMQMISKQIPLFDAIAAEIQQPEDFTFEGNKVVATYLGQNKQQREVYLKIHNINYHVNSNDLRFFIDDTIQIPSDSGIAEITLSKKGLFDRILPFKIWVLGPYDEFEMKDTLIIPKTNFNEKQIN